MDNIDLSLNDEDREKVKQLIERAYYAGIEQGKKEERLNAENLKALNDLVKQQEIQRIVTSPIRYSDGGGGGTITSPLHPPYKITCTTTDMTPKVMFTRAE